MGGGGGGDEGGGVHVGGLPWEVVGIARFGFEHARPVSVGRSHDGEADGSMRE